MCIFKDEKGQAIAEMAVAMIAIMAVFLAVIFAFAIGSTNIDSLLVCRENADNYSYSQVYGGGSRQIGTWSEGADGRMYTNDDVAEPLTIPYDPELFRGELKNNAGNIDIDNFDEDHGINNYFTAKLAESNAVFLTAADLTSYSLVSDPYDTMNIEDLRGAFSTLFFSSDLLIRNSVYMPMLNISELVEDETE